jgi:hypothetical protein
MPEMSYVLLQQEDGELQFVEMPAEFRALDLLDEKRFPIGGLQYVNELEQTFASIREGSYPLVSLLTEIRALQAQLEQWYEDEEML